MRKRFEVSRTTGTLRSITDSLVGNRNSLERERSTTMIDEKVMQAKIEHQPWKPMNTKLKVLEVIKKLNKKASRRIINMRQGSEER